MFINSKVHHVAGKSYTTKVTQTRHDYIEQVSCCVCHIFHNDDDLNWVDPETGDLDNYGVPFCRSCFASEFDIRMAA